MFATTCCVQRVCLPGRLLGLQNEDAVVKRVVLVERLPCRRKRAQVVVDEPVEALRAVMHDGGRLSTFPEGKKSAKGSGAAAWEEV